MEDKIKQLEKAVKYLAEELDKAYKTINRINNVDTYNISDYERQHNVDGILELPS